MQVKQVLIPELYTSPRPKYVHLYTEQFISIPNLYTFTGSKYPKTIHLYALSQISTHYGSLPHPPVPNLFTWDQKPYFPKTYTLPEDNTCSFPRNILK